MPQLIYEADDIAKEYGQDILLVDFLYSKNPTKKRQNESEVRDIIDWSFAYDKEARERFEAWMKTELPEVELHFAYPPLGPSIIIAPYMGHIALIVNKEDQPDTYNKIVGYWEDADGKPRFDDTRLYLVPKDFWKEREPRNFDDFF